MEKIYTATMTNDLNDMKRMIIDLNHFLKSHQIPDKLFYEANLVIEEPLANIIRHSSKDDRMISIRIKVEINPVEIAITITDDGPPFNPLSVPHMDIRTPAIERPTKGLGMHLVRNIMNAMWYERSKGENIFYIQLERPL